MSTPKQPYFDDPFQGHFLLIPRAHLWRILYMNALEICNGSILKICCGRKDCKGENTWMVFLMLATDHLIFLHSKTL